MAGVGELETSDGVVLVFIGRVYSPSSFDGPLPSHLILLGHKIVISLFTPFNQRAAPKQAYRKYYHGGYQARKVEIYQIALEYEKAASAA